MQILKEEVRDRIIQAATEEFLEVGFQLSSTRKISKKAQISNGNLYNYFNSKEALFYAITDPFHHYFSNFLVENFADGATEDFGHDRIALLSAKLSDMLKQYHRAFIMIMDQSQGTKYQDYKANLIQIVTDHFSSNISRHNNPPSHERDFIIQILAINFVEALLEIARHFQNEHWAAENIKLFLLYHAKGMTQFY